MWETNGRKSSNLVKSYEPICHFIRGYLGAEYLVVVSSRSLKTREKYTNWDNLVCLSLYIFWGVYVLSNFGMMIFTILCQKKSIWHFHHSKLLKSKHTSLKKYTNWDKLSCLSLYIFLSFWWNPEETKTKCSKPKSNVSIVFWIRGMYSEPKILEEHDRKYAKAQTNLL